jgi:competence protein ComEA
MYTKLPAVLTACVSITAFAAVDVNKATQAELESVTGIGPAAAAKILDERRNGPFKNWDDLVGRVKGVGAGNAARLSAEGLTVGGASYKAATPKTDATDRKAAAEIKPKLADAPASAAKK